MRFHQLDLLAWGHFTDERLDLSAPGLHVVYGPNEAGKSTALRAMRQFLYGIDTRTADNFIHPHPKLRIGATLATEDGTTLEAIRRKGRKKTLQRPDGEVLDEALLRSMLANVGRDTFFSLFGIDHRALRRGGEALLLSGGNLGESLFSAAGGIANLRKIRDALQAEQDGLFLVRGRNQSINAALSQHAKLEKRAAEEAASPEDWARRRAQRDAIVAELAELDRTRRELSTRVSRARRHLAAWPLVRRLSDRQEALAEVADAPLLPDDFLDRSYALLAERDKAEKLCELHAPKLQEINTALDAVHVPRELIRDADHIRRLTTEAGAYAKARGDRPGLLTRLEESTTALRDCARKLRPDLDPDAVAQHIPDRSDRLRIQDLGRTLQKLENDLGSQRRARDEAERQLSRLDNELQALPRAMNPAALDEAREQANKGELEQRLAQALQDEVAATEHVETALSALGLWSGTSKDAQRLPVPPRETIRAHKDTLDTVDAAVQEARGQQAAIEDGIRRTQDLLAELAQGGSVPSRGELNDSRTLRDVGWLLLRRQWLEGEAPDDAALMDAFPTARDLPQAYEHSVAASDEVADKLLAEAKRVNQAESLTADLLRQQEELAQATTAHAKRTQARDAAWRNWEQLWEPCAITPLPPREMNEWLDRLENIRQQAKNLHELRGTISLLSTSIEGHRASIAARISELGREVRGGNLSELLSHARLISAELGEAAATRRSLEDARLRARQTMENALAALDRARQAEAEARAAWSRAVLPLGLAADADPGQANAVLEDWNDLERHARNVRGFRDRLDGIERDAQAFSREVGHLAKRLAPEVDLTEPDLAAYALAQRLTDAERSADRQAALDAQRKENETALADAEATRQQAAQALATLCEQAGCTDPGGLADAGKRSQARRSAEAAERDARDQLQAHAANTPLDEFITEVTRQDPDDLEASIRALEEQLEETGRLHTEQATRSGALAKELEAADGVSLAARTAQEAQDTLSGLRTDVDRLVRLRLASAILDAEIERYRELNQGPILRAAGDLFRTLTLGRFQAVRAEYDGQDNPILTGITDQDASLTVEAMSDGSRDQLYLSLRLAALGRYLDANTPLPFIADDLLVNFDDARASAALTVLGELSTRTQVIYFTHHEHLVRLAEDAVPGELLTRHTLGA